MREIDTGESGLFLYEVGVEDWEGMDTVLAATGVESNFTCFPQLWAFAIKEPAKDFPDRSTKLYLSEFQDQKRIILERKRRIGERSVSDVRILFTRTSDDDQLLEVLRNHFQPQYIAYNLIPKDQLPKDCQNFATRNELILNVNSVANLEDLDLKQRYEACVSEHKLSLEQVKPEDETRIFHFLDSWCKKPGRQLGKRLGITVTAENDRKFIRDFLKDPRIKGWLVINDKGKVVGISFYTYHPSAPKDLAVVPILKNHRGFIGLGQWFEVEVVRQLQKEGYTWALFGGTEVETQTDFKRQFIKVGGRENTYHSCEIYKDESIPWPENYLRDIWG